MIDLDKLERIAKEAPADTWNVWTSHSWRRVMASDGGTTTRVMEPVVQRHDNHPDLMFGPGVVAWLEGVTPAAVLELIAEVRALRAGEPNMRHPKIQHLISQKARQSIELNMIDRMIDEPDFEYSGSDYDYQTNLTDKVEAFVKAARGAA